MSEVPAAPRVVLVTGGTRGIGAACVRKLAEEGARVVFTGRDREAGQALAAEISRSVFVAGDASVEADCRRAVDAALDLGGGRLSGLVNNAGSAFLFTRHALQGLRAGGGAVVMMSSIAGLAGERGLAIYTASKAALIGLTYALALEYGSQVRFNAICPGQIATRMMGRTLEIPGRRQMLEARIPVHRLGNAEDVAEAVSWLLSPASSFIDGVALAVDGGETAGFMTPPSPAGAENTPA